jgi:hypothetical protein
MGWVKEEKAEMRRLQMNMILTHHRSMKQKI